MTRSESKQAMLCDLGAVPAVADALDPDQVAEAVARARPEVIVHQLTAIGALDMRHFDRDFALTNRLRTEGTGCLLSAGQNAGVRRFVAQAVADHSGRWSSVPGHCMPCPGGVPSRDRTSSLSRNGARAARTASSTVGSARRAGPPNEANTPAGSNSAATRGHRPSGFVQCSAAAA